MRCISWNVRGLGSAVKVRKVNSLVRGYDLEIMLLQETMKTVWSEEEVRKLLIDDEFEFEWVEADDKSGGLLIVWDRNCFVKTIVFKKKNFLSITEFYLELKMRAGLLVMGHVEVNFYSLVVMSQASVVVDDIGVGYRGDIVNVEIAYWAGSDFLSLLH
ncbi:hypothetical protein V6N12_050839 [Hibiscus sabdariffa]|uniref:Uncharacterized protein n=1 Tax=Hibiscus sabdariffa TaxID=183260 RepID=A0ABR2GFC4_9ROSI